jgi:hypothetical protein
MVVNMKQIKEINPQPSGEKGGNKMTYNGALVMPRNCVAMTADEMTYAEGGLTFTVDPALKSKVCCAGLAGIFAYGTGLSAARVAMEIYAHAFLYYTVAPVGSVIAAVAAATGQSFSATAISSGVNYIKTHSNPIDIGNDSAVRVAIFKVIWDLF